MSGEMMGMPESAPPAPQQEDNGPVSVFLSKETLGGETPKEGDTLTFRVKSIDPETGDVEAVVEPKPAAGGPSPTETAFDKAIPEE